jgi:N-acetyl-D-muramate 6-phosphate phosphatase
MKAGIFFDLDGTILDTAPAFVNTITLLCEHYQIPPPPHERICGAISKGLHGLLHVAFQRSSPILEKQFLELYMPRIHKDAVFFKDLFPLFDWIDKRSIPWGIVTNRLEHHTTPLLQTLSLLPTIPVIVYGDTLSVSKPDPAPLLYACQKAQAEPSKSLYIGDAECDAIAGCKAGMTTAVALYGYVNVTDTPTKWGASMLCNTPQQASDEIKNWWTSTHSH